MQVSTLLKQSGLPRLEAQVLLQHVLQVPRTWLLAHDNEVPADAAARQFRQLCQARQAGEPIAYLVGEREFMQHCFMVSPAVLIPRPETELLVETAIQYVRQKQLTLSRGQVPARPVRVLDLGTGSGAIAISVALACPGAQVVATDVSGAALRVARDNAKRLGAIVEFYQGSWYHALPDLQTVDLIVSNPPYIPAADHHLGEGDLRFEPGIALSDGGDGLEAFRHIIGAAPQWLEPGGALWLEHGWDQAGPVRQLLQAAYFLQPESRQDLAGIYRVSGGHL